VKPWMLLDLILKYPNSYLISKLFCKFHLNRLDCLVRWEKLWYCRCSHFVVNMYGNGTNGVFLEWKIIYNQIKK
jgi:hypothetical protein